jgi:hypothetical protein
VRRRSSGRLAAIVLALVAFAAISAILARWLSTENAERQAIVALLEAQARGDAPAMLRALAGCAPRPACRTAVADLARRLRRPGAVKILALQSETSRALTAETGTTRVAWNAPGRLPVVQCVRVRRTGNVVTGTSVTLLGLSSPIARTGSCP